MAENKLCFKNAFKKFLDKTDEGKFDNKKKYINYNGNAENVHYCEHSNKVVEMKCSESSSVVFKQTSLNSGDLQIQSFQDCDKILSEHINTLRSLCVTEKNTSVRKENENTHDSDLLSLESRAQPEDFINNISEIGDKFEFFNEVQTVNVDPKTSEVNKYFLDNVSEGIHNNSSNKQLSDAEVCDKPYQVSFQYNNNSHYLKSTELQSVIAYSNKQEHQELEHYRKLFIGNFDEDIDTEELYYYFLQFGRIERTINIRKHKARSKYIGYIIVFQKTDSITIAQTSAPHVIHNKTLKLYLPKNDGCEPEKFCKLFVGNLNSRTTENDLKNYFQRWGKIVNCVVKRKSVTDISKCYGSVTFKLFRAMNDALVFPYHQIRGQNLKVDMYHEAEDSFCKTQKMHRKPFSNKDMCKKEFLSERQMLTIIEKSKIFKPMVLNYKLSDFDGAGVNVFNKSSLPKQRSSNWSSDSLSPDDVKNVMPKLQVQDFDADVKIFKKSSLSKLKSNHLNYDN